MPIPIALLLLKLWIPQKDSSGLISKAVLAYFELETNSSNLRREDGS